MNIQCHFQLNSKFALITTWDDNILNSLEINKRCSRIRASPFVINLGNLRSEFGDVFWF
jgi:hypothetical protein